MQYCCTDDSKPLRRCPTRSGRLAHILKKTDGFCTWNHMLYVHMLCCSMQVGDSLHCSDGGRGRGRLMMGLSPSVVGQWPCRLAGAALLQLPLIFLYCWPPGLFFRHVKLSCVGFSRNTVTRDGPCVDNTGSNLSIPTNPLVETRDSPRERTRY